MDENIQGVTINPCYICPRSPLHSATCQFFFNALPLSDRRAPSGSFFLAGRRTGNKSDERLPHMSTILVTTCVILTNFLMPKLVLVVEQINKVTTFISNNYNNTKCCVISERRLLVNTIHTATGLPRACIFADDTAVLP